MPVDENIFDDFDDNPDLFLDDVCPNCGEDYDAIDFEYQFCHFCGFNNNKTQTNVEI